MRVLLLAAIALVLSTAAFAQSPPGAGQLSGAQIRQLLIGKTLSGVDKGESYSESLNPDGTIAGHSASGDYSGKWQITGNQICFFYEGETEPGKWDCTGARLQGTQVTWDDGATAMVNAGPGPAPRSPSGAGQLSGAQIQQALIGKTLSGVEKGEAYSESLNPDGTIAGHSASGDYSGKWRIAGNQICFFYEGEGDKWECTGAKLQGAQVTWDDGTTATVNVGRGSIAR